MNFHFTARQRLLTWVITATLVSLGAAVYVLTVQLPTVAARRGSVDSHRAAIILANQRANNLQAVAKQLTEIADQQKTLDNEIWKFADEEKFFDLWTDLSRRSGVTMTEPVVSDATPTGRPVARTVTITITGPVNNMMTAITSIQELQPIIAITAVTFTPAALPNQVVGQIEASSLWH